ncbi:hypothetical protein O6H91_03G041300 [Diphasiastrum complanatum]|uniref:Uncharacterized protein n=2 Tax=Diphasiastrum complanatum TaxID=34168 RepID=A0ACC2E5R4_DIPCM|nr:hypothetical protein O6H91_03G041300 [Diphasiastrum complanatum]KAJ7561789.1 hypothetical protein O6H91_03G041300 [Diphasiastrum complanatum]
MALRHQVANTETAGLRHGRPLSPKISKPKRVIENGKQASEVCLSLQQGRTSLCMPGGKPRSSGSSQQSRGHELHSVGKEGRSNEDTGTESDSERHKGKGYEGDVLLQWGQRKRQRNGRLDTKTSIAEDCPVPSKKQLRVDRRLEKTSGAVQTQANSSKKEHSLRPCTPSVLEATGGNGRSVIACGDNGSTLCHAADVHGSRWSPVKRDGRESPLSMDEPDNAVTCNQSGSRGSYAANVEEHAEVEDAQGTAVVEKISLEFFEWPKFVVSLSRKEKEDDFFGIKGSKLPQRPKKRSKHTEKFLHYVSPGMWLCDLTRERYEVRERKTTKKKPRGLKAMGSVDSDSE